MRKLLGALLMAAAALALCGCSALFDTEYYVTTEYEAPSDDAAAEPEEETEDDAAGSISNYTALKRAITQLVSEHVESAELQFQNYDGSISQDISTACWEVKSSTALGAFAVDYISYDLSRIVSYYQAEIYITYKRSASQVAALEQTENMSALAARLDEALRAGETYLVLGVSAASATAQTVREDVERSYYDDPLACPVLPEIEVNVYPESGVSRIMEVTLDYGCDSLVLSRMRQELGAALDVMAAQTVPEDGGTYPDAERVRILCRYLAENCVYDPDASSTAWDALVGRTADSAGLAMALEAGCQAIGVGCQVVSGRMDGESHIWNIVTLEDSFYHVDVSNWAAGEAAAFLAGDEDIWGAYWWDTSEYPVCPASYSETEIAEASGESDAAGA